MKNLWAIADLHLSLSTPSKDMGILNPLWRDYAKRLEDNWKKVVQPQDVVILAGDISWAMRLQRALIDLNWLHRLPGTKILVRGNHDFWWASAAKLAQHLPPSCKALTNSAIEIDSLAIAGTRLWGDDECEIGDIFFDSNFERPAECDREYQKRQLIVLREQERLRRSLSSLPQKGGVKIAVTHFPPIGTSLAPTRASRCMREFGVDMAIFGHLHNVRPDSAPFGSSGGIDYILCSADYLDFSPRRILSF